MNSTNLFILFFLFIFFAILLYSYFYQSSIKEGLKGIQGLPDFSNFFKEIGEIFKFVGSLPRRFRALTDGTRKIFRGINDEISGMQKGFSIGYEDITDLIHHLWEFFTNYFNCGQKFLKNLPYCIVFYILDFIGNIMYLPITIIIIICKNFLKIDLTKIETKIWNGIYSTDIKLSKFIGFRLTKYPRYISDMCYSCKRLKLSVIEKRAINAAYDFTVVIPPKLVQGVDNIIAGGERLIDAF